MARKITHSKRGTYYNGPTGRHKVSDPLGSLLFSAAKTMNKSSKSSKKKKTSASYSSYSNAYSSNSGESVSSSGCIALCIIILLIVVFFGFIFSKCSSGSSNHSSRRTHGRWQHPERYRPQNNIFFDMIADPWHCLIISK